MTFSRSVPLPWLASLALAATCSLSVAARAETLTVEEAVRRAASQNPSLRAALLEATAARQAVAAEEGARKPTLSASVTGDYKEPFHNGADPVDADGDGVPDTDANDKPLTIPMLKRSSTTSVTSDVALRYTTDVGTSLEVGASARSGTPGPNYGAQAYVSARQPLLRGAGTDAVLAPYAQAQASAVAAEQERELAASQTALDVLGAYWELWYAEQAILVQEQALAAAERLRADAKARAETLGTGTKVDVLRFSTSAASIADALSQARATRAARAIALGRALGMAPASAASLAPTGAPPSLGALPSADALVRAASERSLELAALRADLDAQRARVSAAEDADQIRLDLFAMASMDGQWVRDGLPGLSLPGGRPAFGVLGGIEVELPLGGGRASADAARARTQLAAAEARYQARAEAIAADVSSLRASLEAAAEQVALATETARMAGELAEAERQRLSLGTATSADVVQAEQTRREAELRRLRAAVTELTSRLQLDHETGALLVRFASVLPRRSS
ncbi:TolC family protein [Sorangium sp. KYC3313]|uniref:TolC family protein n=1 Tax=Sorangium sp. KYC3313 TaxID=3449740 RepID=UPI003F8AFBFA